MNTLTVWVFLAMFLGGCGKGLMSPPVDHGVFEPYFQAFEQASIANGRDTLGDDAIAIEFGDQSTPGDAGTCYSGFDGSHVEINEQVWNSFDDTYRILLVFHELGHCLLNRQHDFNVGADNYPVSIMNPDIVVITEVWSERSQQYVQELFQ